MSQDDKEVIDCERFKHEDAFKLEIAVFSGPLMMFSVGSKLRIRRVELISPSDLVAHRNLATRLAIIPNFIQATKWSPHLTTLLNGSGEIPLNDLNGPERPP